MTSPASTVHLHARLPRRAVDALHREPRVQARAAPARVRPGHALRRGRRPPRTRRHGRPLVRECRTRRANLSSAPSRNRPPRSITPPGSRWATRSPSTWPGASPALTPDDLDRIFFTNSGSEAVDTALKIALAYWKARGSARARPLRGPTPRLPRRRIRRHVRGRHRGQPATVRGPAPAERRPSGRHPRPGAQRVQPRAAGVGRPPGQRARRRSSTSAARIPSPP